MHLILLSGGSGKRLWPLSNEVRSKQFLKILESKDGTLESMVQRVYRQINEAGKWDSITVACSDSQKDQIKVQLGDDVNIVVEPERRDTFPAIVLAVSYLYSHKKVRRDEFIAILPVDPYVEVDFFVKIHGMEKEFRRKKIDLLLIGAIPLFPSEKYGYIIPKEKEENLNSYGVKIFKEKPNSTFAKILVDEGALWNCGIFGLEMGYILDILEQKYNINNFDYEAMKISFLTLHKNSFDYEIVEKAENIRVMKYEGNWKDLGSWETFTEEIGSNSIGNVVKDGNCYNTHIVNEQEIPLVVIDIDDSVIIASYDGILVAKKGSTFKLKNITTNIASMPMYEERNWGTFIVLDNTVTEEGEQILTKKLCIKENSQISYHYHNNRKEIWNIISGNGILYFEGEKQVIKTGESIVINEKKKHGIFAASNLEIVEIQISDFLDSKDIVRIQYDWELS